MADTGEDSTNLLFLATIIIAGSAGLFFLYHACARECRAPVRGASGEPNAIPTDGEYDIRSNIFGGRP